MTSSWSWRARLAALFVASLAWKLFCLRRFVLSALYPSLDADASIYWVWAHQLGPRDWLGHNAFFLGPLYPYLLAGLHLAADSIVPALAAQCVFGAFTVVLVALAASHLCSRSSALAVGVLAAGSSMATFMDLSLLSESLLGFLGMSFLLLQLRDLGRTLRFHAPLSGLLAGIMALARPTNLLLLLVPVVSRFASSRWRAAVRTGSIAVLCACLLCLPVVIRHLALGYGWIPITYSLGYNFYVGNGSAATGGYSSRLGDLGQQAPTAAGWEGGAAWDGRSAIPLDEIVRPSPTQSSAWWFGRARREIASSPARFSKLLLRKAALSLNHTEATQIENIHVRERIVGPLGFPLFGTFGIIGVLGLFGLAIGMQTSQGRMLGAYVLAAWLPMVIFFVTDRYRYHVVLPLLVACGPGLDHLQAWFADAAARTWRDARDFGWLAAAALIVWLPMAPYERQQADFATHRTVAEVLVRTGRLADAEKELRECVSPAALAKLPLDRVRAARISVASAFESLADLYLVEGFYLRSEEALVAALHYAPDLRELRVDHALTRAISGSVENSVAEAGELQIARPEFATLILRVAQRTIEARSWGAAERSLRAAIAVDSTNEAANIILLRLLHSEGRSEDLHELWGRLPGRAIGRNVIEREGASLALVP